MNNDHKDHKDQYGEELHRAKNDDRECVCGYVGKTSRDVDEHIVAST